MSDAHLRRRHRLVLQLLAHPSDTTTDDDLELHRCALEVEAARRGLDLVTEPVEPARRYLGLVWADWLTLGALSAFGGMVWWSLWVL